MTDLPKIDNPLLSVKSIAKWDPVKEGHIPEHEEDLYHLLILTRKDAPHARPGNPPRLRQ